MADQDRIRDLERQLDEANMRADEADMRAGRMEQQNNDLIRILVRAAIERNNILITFQWMAETLNAAIDIFGVVSKFYKPPMIIQR